MKKVQNFSIIYIESKKRNKKNKKIGEKKMRDCKFGIGVEKKDWELIKEEVVKETSAEIRIQEGVVSAIGESRGTPSFMEKVKELEIPFCYEEVDLDCEYHESDSYNWDRQFTFYPEATIRFF